MKAIKERIISDITKTKYSEETKNKLIEQIENSYNHINGETILLFNIFLHNNIPSWKAFNLAVYYAETGAKFNITGLEWIETYLPENKRKQLIGR